MYKYGSPFILCVKNVRIQVGLHLLHYEGCTNGNEVTDVIVCKKVTVHLAE